MYACMTPVGFDTSDKFENHSLKLLMRINCLNYTAVLEMLKTITDDSPIRSSMRICCWNIYIDHICCVTGILSG